MEYSSVNYYRCSLVKEREVPYGQITDGDQVLSICKAIGLTDASEEFMYMFCCDTSNKIMGIHQIGHGKQNAAYIDTKDIFKRALLNNAMAIILAHNHPSGDNTPSQADIDFTRKIQEVCKLLGVHLLDHIIVTSEDTYFSFLEHGNINK